jgi:hypothetical protein
MVHGGKLIPVDAGIMLMRHLHCGCLYMTVMCGSLLFRSRPGIDPARSAIIADTVDSRISYDRTIDIGVVDDRSVDIGHRRIISETTAFPTPADISRTEISASIIDTAVKADVRPPIPRMPGIDPIAISPITRCP